MSAVERIERLTLDEFVRLYEQYGPFEIINGERRPLMPPVAIHGLMIRLLWRILDAFCVANKIGEVVTEMPFVLTYDSEWVKGSRVPDLMFFAATRWQKYTAETDDWERKPFIIVPDLAIEVVPPNDSFSEVQEKVEHYLSDGVRLVWVVDPMRERVTTYSGGRFTTLGKTDSLSGGDVIPGLEIQLAAVFKSDAE